MQSTVTDNQGSIGEAPRLFTTRDLMEILKVGEIKVRRLLQGGQLPGLRVGCEWRVRAEDLERYLESCRTAPRASTT